MRNLNKSLPLVLAASLLLAGQLLWAGPTPEAAAAPAKSGGVLRYAMIGSPPTLDQHAVTSDLSTTIAQHWAEGLYTFNAKYEPVPMLATGEEVKDGGKLITIQLRQGVLFHNGKEMTSEDVVASLRRWGEFGVRGPVVFQNVDRVEAAGKYAVNLYFKQLFSPWKSMFAMVNGGPMIYPKEVVENQGKEPIGRAGYIGTGPYQFVEWVDDRYISLKRFDKYVASSSPADGYAGKRTAYFDEIRFIPVPDAQTRINGIKAGDYDYAEQIPGDLYDSMKADPSVKVTLNQGAAFGVTFINSKEGIFSPNGPMKNPWKLRQAIMTALNMEPVLRAAVGPEGLWRLNGSITPEGTFFYTKAGTDKYSLGDVAKAKELAAEAGYKGEKIVFMSTSQYKDINDTSVVMDKQLRDAGFNIDFQVYDWATLVSRRAQPALWDMFQTRHGFVPDPILYTFMSVSYPGWWDTPEKAKLANEFTGALDMQARKAAWEKIQALVYEQVPIIKTGDQYFYDIYSPKVQGIGDTQLIWPKFWGVSFK
jgi:peptide/nickel transport system substrate-binding protein